MHDNDIVLAAHHRHLVRRALRALVLAEQENTPLDVETFLRSANLPFALERLIRYENTKNESNANN